MMLSEDQKKNGVIAASAGNHALALAYHGGKLSKYYYKFCYDSRKYNLVIVKNLFLHPKIRHTCNGGNASCSPNYESRKL